MRILIGSQVESTFRPGRQPSRSVDRVLWFAEPGDLVLLPSPPSEVYVEHVLSMIGVSRDTLTFGFFGWEQPDNAYAGLDDPSFADSWRGLTCGVTSVFSLWPAASVARFCSRLGIEERFEGHGFVSQGGGQIANSKAYFRAFAAGCGVEIATGTVCHTIVEAIGSTMELMASSGSVVVKQAHNGSGAGNEIVTADLSLSTGHAGAVNRFDVDGSGNSLKLYWAERWEWASSGGRYPVVVEEFVPATQSVFTEHLVSDSGVCDVGSGLLFYADKSLRHQSVPLASTELDSGLVSSLVQSGHRLATFYRSLGYRGYLSADAIIDGRKTIRFTEVNAHVSGSAHLYDIIQKKLAPNDALKTCTVTEFPIPSDWRIEGIGHFLSTLRSCNLLFDSKTRRGALVSAPISANNEMSQFLFCIVHATPGELQEIYDELSTQFIDTHTTGKAES